MSARHVYCRISPKSHPLNIIQLKSVANKSRDVKQGITKSKRNESSPRDTEPTKWNGTKDLRCQSPRRRQNKPVVKETRDVKQGIRSQAQQSSLRDTEPTKWNGTKDLRCQSSRRSQNTSAANKYRADKSTASQESDSGNKQTIFLHCQLSLTTLSEGVCWRNRREHIELESNSQRASSQRATAKEQQPERNQNYRGMSPTTTITQQVVRLPKKT